MTEASWGADPLSFPEGFRPPPFDNEREYLSSLAPNGRVSWSNHQLESFSNFEDSAEAILIVGFPNVDWRSLLTVYGWAALQYQAWARGHLVVAANSTQTIIFYTDNVLEFWIDDDHYFGGDYYADRRAPLVLRLKPGKHNVDIRLIRDVRVMGGVGEPKISIKLKAEGSGGSLALIPSKAILPDIINGVLASPFASIPVRNEGQNAVKILEIRTEVVCSHSSLRIQYC